MLRALRANDEFEKALNESQQQQWQKQDLLMSCFVMIVLAVVGAVVCPWSLVFSCPIVGSYAYLYQRSHGWVQMAIEERDAAFVRYRSVLEENIDEENLQDSEGRSPEA
jgi:hypothetical protein